jgi:hypothetical protein
MVNGKHFFVTSQPHDIWYKNATRPFLCWSHLLFFCSIENNNEYKILFRQADMAILCDKVHACFIFFKIQIKCRSSVLRKVCLQ